MEEREGVDEDWDGAVSERRREGDGRKKIRHQ
jgi:hypothetical protein